MITRPTFGRLIAVCLALGIAVPLPLYAQQEAGTAPTSSATPTAAPAGVPASTNSAAQPAAKVAQAPDAPNPEVLKKARNAGFHTKVRNNTVLYCKTDTDTGTRFSTEKCLNEAQLLQHLDFAQAQKDQLIGHSCAGSGCSGK
jgi:hypothetical protein